jgi:hypothetical protein
LLSVAAGGGVSEKFPDLGVEPPKTARGRGNDEEPPRRQGRHKTEKRLSFRWRSHALHSARRSLGGQPLPVQR